MGLLEPLRRPAPLHGQEGTVTSWPGASRDLDLAGKKAFIRVDFNVPIKGGAITDDTRIRASLPTITHALDRGATVILASHLGRPKGKPNPEYSLRPVAARLSELLGRPVVFAEDCIGEPARQAIAGVGPGGRCPARKPSLPRRRREERSRVRAQLAELADIYVNDAFGSAHRAHASTEGIVHQVKEAAAGLLMAKESSISAGCSSNPIGRSSRSWAARRSPTSSK